MSGHRTLRCRRTVGLLLFGVAAFAGMSGKTAWLLVTDDLPDHSAVRRVGALLIVLLLLGLTVLMAAALRSRVVMDDSGVELVTSFKRHRIPWKNIERVTVHPGFRVWRVRVWADGVGRLALLCPTNAVNSGVAVGPVRCPAFPATTWRRPTRPARCAGRTRNCAPSGSGAVRPPRAGTD